MTEESLLGGVDAADLPASLREIVALIGLPAALTLVHHYGGVRLYLPKEMDPGHVLVRLLGHDAAMRLITYRAAGDYIEVPLAERAIRAARNRAIRARMQRGATAAAVARAFGMTERHVWRILDGAPVDDGQERLF